MCAYTHILICVGADDKVAAAPATGWRRCIGCLELQVSFHQKATGLRAFAENDL